MQWWQRPFAFPSGTSPLVKAVQLVWLPVWMVPMGYFALFRHDFISLLWVSMFAGVFLFLADYHSYEAQQEARRDAALSCGCMACLRAAGL